MVSLSLPEQADELASRFTAVELVEAAFTPPLEVVMERSSSESLIVVGAPRVGKTALAFAWTQEMLKQRLPGQAVPIQLDLGSWDDSLSVQEWLSQTVEGHLDSLGLAEARALVDAGLVHPVLDGLDELPPSERTKFLCAVAELPFPVLLTSRPVELGGRLPVLELTAAPLHATLLPWPSVVEVVRNDPAGPVAIALADPVNRYLFAGAQSNGSSDPVKLADREAFPDAASIEKHLFNDADPALQRRVRHLAALARHTGDEGIAWWRLASLAPRWVFWLAIVVSSLPSGVLLADHVVAALQTLTSVTIAWWQAVLLVGVVLGSLLGWAGRPRPPVAFDLSRLLSKLSLVPLFAVFCVSVTFKEHSRFAAAPVFVLMGIGLFWTWSFMVVSKAVQYRSDHPLRWLWPDRAVFITRAVMLMLSALIALHAIDPSFLDATNPISGFLILGMVLAACGSASLRYDIAGWFPRSSYARGAADACAEAGELVRRDGGVFRFRNDQVREALKDSRFDTLGPHTAESATAEVSRLRRFLAQEACRRTEVRGLVDDEDHDLLIAQVSEDVLRHTGTIVASASAARDKYQQAKVLYAFSVLKISLLHALFVQKAMRFAGPSGYFLAVASGNYLLLHYFALALAPTIVNGAGFSLLWLAATQATKRYRSRRQERTRALELSTIACGAIVSGYSLHIATLANLLGQPEVLVTLYIFAIGAFTTSFYAITTNIRANAVRLASHDPKDWPEPASAHEQEAHSVAVRTHGDWIDALVERGVRPLVGLRLSSLVKRSYATVLPVADVRRLGDITDMTQYVQTEVSRRLVRMMKVMSRGAIGISGPRGVGKSTVLKMFGELGFGSELNDLRLVVPAPTTYASREFLVYLYATLCTRLIGTEPQERLRRRNWPWLLASAVGALTALSTWRSAEVLHWASLAPQYWRWAVIGTGLLIAVVPLIVLWVRSRRTQHRQEEEVAQQAQRRLDGLRYVETTTLTGTLTLKPPAVAEAGRSHARARAHQVKTFPELVGEFREFLVFLTSRKPGSRVLLCIDELDKIASAQDAERFLNDIKAVFGVEGCFFLVAVSDDALATFSQRSLAIRTAFDSAFDNVVSVRRFALADTRRLLVQRVALLPEPFVWLCHVLSGGLPRELNRTVRELYDQYTATKQPDLAALTHALVRVDLDSVVHGLSTRLAERFDDFGVQLRQHILGARRLDLTESALLAHELPTPLNASDELLLVHAQFRSYLIYAATVLRVFCRRINEVITALENTEAEEIELLAVARGTLAADPVAAAAYVRDWEKVESQGLR